MPQSIPTWTSGSKVKPGIVFICRPWAKKEVLNIWPYMPLKLQVEKHIERSSLRKACTRIIEQKLLSGLFQVHYRWHKSYHFSVPHCHLWTTLFRQQTVSRRNHLWLCLCCSEFSGAQLNQYCNYLFLCCSSKSLIISLIEWPQKQGRAASPMHIHLIKMGLRDRAVTACIF